MPSTDPEILRLDASLALQDAHAVVMQTTLDEHTLDTDNPHGDALADLTDVDTTGAADGQALLYDDATETWGPGDIAAGSTPADDNATDLGSATHRWHDVHVGGAVDGLDLNRHDHGPGTPVALTTTTQGEWEAGTLTHIDTTTEAGSICLTVVA